VRTQTERKEGGREGRKGRVNGRTLRRISCVDLGMTAYLSNVLNNKK